MSMSSIPPGPSTPPSQPYQGTGPSSSGATPASNAQDAALLNSPFAKMFANAGGQPTAKQVQQIINGVLKNVIDEVKRDEARAKAEYEKMKKVIEGNDDS